MFLYTKWNLIKIIVLHPKLKYESKHKLKYLMKQIALFKTLVDFNFNKCSTSLKTLM